MNVGNVNDHPCYVWTRKFKTKDKNKRTPLVMMHGMGAGENLLIELPVLFKFLAKAISNDKNRKSLKVK